MAGPTLECRELTCGYHGKTVLSGVSFTAQAGESIALLGANGSGKSTLLKTINRLIPALSGQVLAGGRAVSALKVAELAREIASVPQDEQTRFEFSVREIVTMGRLSFGSGIFDTPEDVIAAEKAMQVAGCEELAERPITELSGGERQRVLIARAIAQDAPILLMDEPTAHLDPPHQIALANIARNLAAGGRIVISAVHDLNLAPVLATRALLIANGRIVLDDTVEAVLTSPLLDEAYGSRFERVRADSGRLLIVPAHIQPDQP